MGKNSDEREGLQIIVARVDIVGMQIMKQELQDHTLAWHQVYRKLVTYRLHTGYIRYLWITYGLHTGDDSESGHIQLHIIHTNPSCSRADQTKPKRWSALWRRGFLKQYLATISGALNRKNRPMNLDSPAAGQNSVLFVHSTDCFLRTALLEEQSCTYP